jgi:hypothetical protein
MTSDEKLLNTKVLELIKTNIPYIGHFVIFKSVSEHYSQNLGSHIEFMKLCERLVNFELNFSYTFSNRKMTYIEIVDLDESSKLRIHDFQI